MLSFVKHFALAMIFIKQYFFLLFLASFLFVSCEIVEPRSEKIDILTYDFLAAENEAINANVIGLVGEEEISLLFPYKTNVSFLKPHITHNGDSISPDPNSPIDLTKDISYTVYSEDGASRKYDIVINFEDPYINLNYPARYLFEEDFIGKPLDVGNRLLPVSWSKIDQKSVAGLRLDLESNCGPVDYTIKMKNDLDELEDITDNPSMAKIIGDSIILRKLGYYEVTATAEEVEQSIDFRLISNMPDDNLRQSLKTLSGIGNEVFNEEDVLITDNFRVEGSQWLFLGDKEIISLFGIQHFKAVTRLEIADNNIKKLDLSELKALERLTIWNNQLSSLDISQNQSLEQLYSHGNTLTNINVTQNPNLINLDLAENQITEIDLSNNVKLESLSLSGNNVEQLDLSNNPLLIGLSVDGNRLSTLDLSNNVNLETIKCYSNRLSKLDVSHLLKLRSLACGLNQISELDVSNSTLLATLWINWNSIKKLDLTMNSEMSNVILSHNPIEELTFADNGAFSNEPSYLRLPKKFACMDEVKTFKQKNPTLQIYIYSDDYSLLSDNFDPNSPGACN